MQCRPAVHQDVGRDGEQGERMIVDMRCPKCGGNTARYEGHRWRCLKCSNFFIYEPPAVPTTTVQHFVNVSGDAQYDLDVSGAIAARPRYDTVEDGWPDAVSHLNTILSLIKYRQKEVAGYKKAANIMGIVAITFGGITVMLLQNWLLIAIATGAVAIVLTIASLSQLLSEDDELKGLEQQKAELEKPKAKNIIAYQPICPYCRAEVSAVNKVLTHCLKCGKRFYYAEPTSFPIKVP